MQRIRHILMFFLAGLILAGCGPKRPVLYPNAHLDEVGMQVAQADIDDCVMKAEAAGANATDTGAAAGNVAKSGAIGAAAGAVFGAIMGNGVGRAAAATGGAAAAGSAVNEGFKSGDPTTIHKNFVERCLREKGYDVIGWK
jgi:predicted small lipoprotein YifL